MAMDVNQAKARPLMTIAAGSRVASSAPTQMQHNQPPPGCCDILTRLLCMSRRSKTANVGSSDVVGDDNYNRLMLTAATATPPAYTTLAANTPLASYQHVLQQQQQQRKAQSTRRRTPQEIYFESRGKSCKKLLKFNGSSNKILLYPEEGWARTACSSYWTITPCWWQPNRCRIEEFAGTQRQATKAKMLPLEQKGSLLIAGHFRSKKNTLCHSSNSSSSHSSSGSGSSHHGSSSDKNTNVDEFKLYLTSNISMEDYNMGYCLTGFVERRCQHTNAFQMTHFAVIRRQWPAVSASSGSSSSSSTNGNGNSNNNTKSSSHGNGNSKSRGRSDSKST